eukprot:CAMPEP_0202899174 /NCGR_PEP_ID=MMETSP1392-20130828/7478_1 /ASSEMBLY_ACC=CAM_ASM_000868 /TAXON_ID=225041 /ORGANISM="Chlamydomonas chlamydogama, Strain SAG 11-48b" /LENGTH=255 /DNA_ID=CAMNT_0049585287 /DNA_START=99 /DNA_END=866 /DNA_ORIENTATION=-
MTFTQEEQETIERLREKYSKHTVAVDPNAPDPFPEYDDACKACIPAPVKAYTGKTSDADVKVCPICQGSGVRIEIYNYRRLERMCETCDGKGVNVYRNGVEVQDPATSTAAQPGSKPTWAQTPRERSDQLQADLRLIDKKLDAYHKEISDLQAAASSAAPTNSSSSGEGQQLRASLLTQLQAQVERLSKVRAAKSASLHRYTHPSTLDDEEQGAGEEQGATSMLLSHQGMHLLLMTRAQGACGLLLGAVVAVACS